MASFGARRETMSVRRRLRMRAACTCIVIYRRYLYNINMRRNAKPQKMRFLRLTYFLTANFGDFEVWNYGL